MFQQTFDVHPTYFFLLAACFSMESQRKQAWLGKLFGQCSGRFVCSQVLS